MEQTAEEAKKWEQKLNKDGVKVLIKKGGSHLVKDLPYIRTDIQFNGHFKIAKVIETVSQVL